MAIRIVRLGSARAPGEGVRLGTVRRPPRGVKKQDYARLLDALALLARDTDFAVGCYCEDPRRCHRSLLGELLAARGAKILPTSAPQPRRKT